MPPGGTDPTRYRFGNFVLSPRTRMLSRGGLEVPLIPRYFDLLVLLIARRNTVVTRQEIFDLVWSDVIVSDGALSQAIRTLRRTLGDGSREPIYIRTVARHGYRFVFSGVIEEDDAAPVEVKSAEDPADTDRFDALIDRLFDPGASEADRRDAAEQLHVLGTADTLRRMGARPAQAAGRAILRDARWDVPGAGPVPILGQPQSIATAWELSRLRLNRAARLARARWAGASAGGAVAGAAAGGIGGAVLVIGPASNASADLPLTLAWVGALSGAAGAAGVGAGLAAAEAVARSARRVALVAAGALGGGLVAGLTALVADALVRHVFGGYSGATAGALDGFALGAAAGFGYGLTIRPPAGGGMATPHGAVRFRAALVTGLCCAMAGVLLSLAGRNLVGGSLNVLSASFKGSQVSLLPLARLIGAPAVGPSVRALASGVEAFCFGCGLIAGLTRRPSPLNHADLTTPS
jgi:DNA-binding winged helix-turn-helix (wHTH) protein